MKVIRWNCLQFPQNEPTPSASPSFTTEDKFLFIKCQQSTCVLQISSLALSKISLWEWFPLSSELWIYSSPMIINIGKYAGSRSDIWKTKTTKQNKIPSWTFPVQSISFLYFSQEPNVSKYCLYPSLNSHPLQLTSGGFSLSIFQWNSSCQDLLNDPHVAKFYNPSSVSSCFTSQQYVTQILDFLKYLFSWIPGHHTLSYFPPTSLILSVNLLCFLFFSSQLVNIRASKRLIL